MSKQLAHKSTRVVFPNQVRPATVVTQEGVIVAVEPHDYSGECRDWGDYALLPGAVDTHVHFNEPGRSEWEGWESGTKAAAAGGVTTVVEMPLNSIPSTVDAQSLRLKLDSMKGKLYCDVGLWGGAVPENSTQLQELLEGGVLGLKCFLSDPGTEEFRHLDEDALRKTMTEIARLGSVLLVHAEWPSALKGADPSISPRDYRSWLFTRPVEAEREAIARIVELANHTGCRCHIVHVSSPLALAPLDNSEITCETCAHYLAFSAEEVEESATNFKCAPPIREASHREGLWKALGQGRIQMVTSDHSPCPPDLKNQSFLDSWGGIAGVQMLLSATWTGASARGYSLSDLARWVAQEPARLAGLQARKGSIEVGRDADLVIFDPEREYRCESLFHRHGGSPYLHRTWKGTVVETFLRGESVYRGGEVLGPLGQFLSGLSAGELRRGHGL